MVRTRTFPVHIYHDRIVAAETDQEAKKIWGQIRALRERGQLRIYASIKLVDDPERPGMLKKTPTVVCVSGPRPPLLAKLATDRQLRTDPTTNRVQIIEFRPDENPRWLELQAPIWVSGQPRVFDSSGKLVRIEL